MKPQSDPDKSVTVAEDPVAATPGNAIELLPLEAQAGTDEPFLENERDETAGSAGATDFKVVTKNSQIGKRLELDIIGPLCLKAHRPFRAAYETEGARYEQYLVNLN